MVKYTKHFQKKLEDLFAALDYTVRYEKGNFNSGYCLVENKRIAVINKFYDTEGRINALLDILQQLDADPDVLGEQQQKLLRTINRQRQQTTEEE